MLNFIVGMMLGRHICL